MKIRSPAQRKTVSIKMNFFIGEEYYRAITSNGRDFLVFRIFASTVSISAVCTPIARLLSSFIATVCVISVESIFARRPSI